MDSSPFSGSSACCSSTLVNLGTWERERRGISFIRVDSFARKLGKDSSGFGFPPSPFLPQNYGGFFFGKMHVG